MTAAPRLSVAPWGESLDELADAARRAEAAGAEAVWVPELHRSATVALAAVAAATTRARVGTAIMWAFVRSPMLIALEALDLDELSDGRLVLGLGTGVRRLNEDWHNRPWRPPVEHLREVIHGVRTVVAHAHDGGAMVVAGEHAPMRIAGYRRPYAPEREWIPVYVAAVGPLMVELAGELGDGWIAHELGSPAELRTRVLPRLARGLERGGRARDEIEVVASACCVPYRDPAQARRWAAALVAFYATVRTYEPFFDRHGFGAEARAVREAFRAGDEDGMVAAVPDAMVDALTVAGSPDRVRERLDEYAGLADAIKLSPPTHLVPAEVTRLIQDEIVALVGDS